MDFRTQPSPLEDLSKVIEPAVNSAGYGLVKVGFEQHHGQTIQVMIERIDEQGISIDDCVKVNRLLSPLVEVELPQLNQYKFEVSSAGIDRPLTSEKDFHRFKGKNIKVELNEFIDNQKKFKGELHSVYDDGFTLKTDDKTFTINFDQIKKAQLNVLQDFFKVR